MVSSNPFEHPDFVVGYEEWYDGAGRRADFLEKSLLNKLLTHFPESQSAPEIGCGTGHFTRWLASQRFEVTGLDISLPMLSAVRQRNGISYVHGDAHKLPFRDRAFDLSFLITTLEFVADPLCALTEAIRVARDGVILGVLNRWSLLTRGYRRSGKRVWQSARFFTPHELSSLVRTAAERSSHSRKGRVWKIVSGLPLQPA